MKLATTFLLGTLVAVLGATAQAGTPEKAASSHPGSVKHRLRAALERAPDTRFRAASDGSVGQPAGVLCPQSAGNCQARDNEGALTSDRIGFLLTDDFVPAVTGSVSQVCWRGAYFDFDRRSDCRTDVAGDRFEIRYFENAGGVPGRVLAEFRQAGGTLSVNGPVATGGRIAGLADEYEYTATHVPVPLEAGRCYWIEISNMVARTDPGNNCAWLWEKAFPGNQWALQDDELDGYDTADALGVDLTFCFDLALGDAGDCVPQAPANDLCADAEPLVGDGTFPFDNTTARTDGREHLACLSAEATQIEADVWYCWTAPCTDIAVVSTCRLTDVDTRIAVYDGCDACPPTELDLLACNDDRCGERLAPYQSLVTFNAVEGQSYLIRIGVFPGGRRGPGSFTVSCKPCGDAACPGGGSCCDAAGTGSPGCGDNTCCNIVCMCDPSCCDTEWDDLCATTGFDIEAPGCGAELLCGDRCTACGTSNVDCCVGVSTGSGLPGCSDPACCEAVCAADPYCCEVEWDTDCATNGYGGNGNGAAILCPELCGQTSCPGGTVEWLAPPDGVVDARQPFPPTGVCRRQGIDSITVIAPAGAGRIGCWDLCETDAAGSPNRIASVTANPDGTLTIGLLRPITPGAVTTITYRGNASTARFAFHPGNVNGDTQSDSSDVTALMDVLTGAAQPVWGIFSADIDRSGRAAPGDILRMIDVLNGGGAYAPGWDSTGVPTADAVCP